MAADVPVRWDARKVVEATLAAAGVAAFFLFVYNFRLVFLGAFVGVVLAAAMRPIMAALARRGLRRDLGALLAFTLLSAIAATVVVIAAPLVVDQVSAVTAKLPGYYAELRSWLAGSPSRLVRQSAARLPMSLDLARTVTPLGADQIFTYVQQLGGGLLLAVAVVLFAFYWTIDGELGAQVLSRLVPLDRRDEARSFIATAESRLGAYVRAQGATCLAVGLMAFTAYSIIGVPNALVFALFVGVMELIPVLGPTLGFTPAVLVMLAIDPATALWVLLAAVTIQLIEAYFLFPRFMGKSAGVHPLTCILALVAFGSLLGLIGFFLAIPMAGVLQLAFERLVVLNEDRITPPLGRERADVIHYDARTLVVDARHLAKSAQGTSDATLHELAEEVEAIASELDRILPDEQVTAAARTSAEAA